MSQNLITSGVVDPAQFPLEQVRQEVAALLKISLNQIERLECWPHQIWVKVVKSRAKFVSYRRLPLWIKQGLEAISFAGAEGNRTLHFTRQPRPVGRNIANRTRVVS
jgi:hypothetical protein